jgi:hypothetical protein
MIGYPQVSSIDCRRIVVENRSKYRKANLALKLISFAQVPAREPLNSEPQNVECSMLNLAIFFTSTFDIRKSIFDILFLSFTLFPIPYFPVFQGRQQF